MDGIAAVSARIAEIQSRIASLQAPPVPAAAAGGGTAFASALSQAVVDHARATAGTTSTTASATARTAAPGTATAPSGRLDARGVPVELAAYGNGKVPASALSPIGHGSHRLWAPAAEAFGRMEKAAARDGVTIKVTDSYRSYEAQVDVARRKGLYSEGGLAAKPGTSDHGWGRSLDLDLDSKALSWMRANAKEFGFVEDVPREPWHWTYTP
ncbi:M15 family metallopeptidase [Thalassiella azotivora]